MKWLFAILVALNIVVFAGMIGYKLLNKYFPQPVAAVSSPAPVQPPAQIVINTGGSAEANKPTTSGNINNAATRKTAPATPSLSDTLPKANTTPNNAVAKDEQAGGARTQYRACSARVSMPEDDYHRIKGLLARFPHAATRQVTDHPAQEGQTNSRMNVLFMSVNDQDASTIQGIVGRYGQLNRAPCDK